MNKHCRARQHSDQMLCECGLGWDINDPEPPVCRGNKVAEQQLAAIRAVLIEPSRFASSQRQLLKIAEMPLRWLPSANIEAGLYTVHWQSMPDVVFVLVELIRNGTGRHYRFFNKHGRQHIEVRRFSQGQLQFEVNHGDGRWQYDSLEDAQPVPPHGR